MPEGHEGCLLAIVDFCYKMSKQTGKRMNRMEVPMKTFTAVIEKCSETGLYVGYVPGLCNPAMANSASEGSRTAVRRIANRCPGDGEQSERSDAVLKNIPENPC